jgi:hypothetical protein
MAKKANWRFWLFIGGAALSLMIVIAEIALIAIGAIADLSWALAAVLGAAALAPTILLGLPYANSRFYVSYNSKQGLVIREERRRNRRDNATDEAIGGEAAARSSRRERGHRGGRI